MFYLSKTFPYKFFWTYFQILTLVSLTQFVVFYVVFATKKIYSLMFSFWTFSSSKSVADGLAHCGLNYTESIDKFIRICDQFFDCLNVCNTLEDQIKRKPTLEPYIDRNDWRVKVFLIFYLLGTWTDIVVTYPLVTLHSAIVLFF